jgi:hypothetical protein
VPTRILRDWTDSEALNSVSSDAERFFTRLLMKMDDYGCFHGDTRLLRANLFPLLIDRIREADITRWIAECEKAGMVRSYDSGGRRFIFVPKHGQRLRDAKHRFPVPECNNLPKSAATCRELPQVAPSRGKSRPDADADADADADTDGGSGGETHASPASVVTPTPEPFDVFWAAYPKCDRKTDRKKCAVIWKREKFDAKLDMILVGLKKWKRSETWTKSAGKYVPLVTTWLCGERWVDAPDPAPVEADPDDNGFVRRPVTHDDFKPSDFVSQEVYEATIKQLEDEGTLPKLVK